MTKYLYRARDSAGNPSEGFVDADSPKRAREKLLQQGFADVVIWDDETTAALREGTEKAGGLVTDPRLHLILLTRPQPWSVMAHAVRTQWIWLVIAAGCIWYAWASGEYAIAWLLVAINVAGVLFPGWVTWQQYGIYRQFWAGRWDASERTARRVRRLWFVQKLPASQLELDARIACALVKKGQFAAALAVLEPWKARSDVPASVVNSKIGTLYFLNRDWQRYLESVQRGLELTGGSDTSKIDVAQTLARMGDDNERAAALLDQVDLEGKRGLARGFALWGRGVIALNKRDDAAALGHLTAAVDGLLEDGANPITWGGLSLATGYLAVATARTAPRDCCRLPSPTRTASRRPRSTPSRAHSRTQRE